MTDRVDDLVAAGHLERVEPDQVTARIWLDAGHRHLEAVAKIIEIDPTGAYSLLYDAARKALAALMLAEGLRARAVPGSHRAMAEYASRVDAEDSDRSHLLHFDYIRRNRNRAEYGTQTFGAAQVIADLEHARAITLLVSKRLGSSTA